MPEVEEMTPPDLETEKKEKKSSKPAKKKSKLKMNLIIIVASQLLLAGGAFYLVSTFIKPDPALQKVLLDQQLQGEQGENAEQGDSEHAEDIAREIHLVEDIVVNPAGTRGARFLSVSIGIEMDVVSSGEESKGGGHGAEAPEEKSPIADKTIQLRDALIRILSSKTIVELTSIEDKEKIREEILVNFKDILKPLIVHQIYFVDYVLQ